MKEPSITLPLTMIETQDRQIQDTIKRERRRLLDFIRKRVSRPEEAEDILQDVFYEMIQMYRLMKPIEQLASWLFTVARNKITDRYRKKKPLFIDDAFSFNARDEEEQYLLADLLPSKDYSLESQLMREEIMEAITVALEELPAEQREVFILHELEGKSFKEIMQMTGAPQNTLLSRKRYAVLYLRERLLHLYEEL